jgi:outer membrane immunogenic protein
LDKYTTFRSFIDNDDRLPIEVDIAVARVSYGGATPGSIPISFYPGRFLGGVHAGYNYQFSDNMVLGVEADIDYSDMSGDGNLSFGGVTDSAFSGSSELDWQGSISARLGYAADRFMPYLTGGVAFRKN